MDRRTRNAGIVGGLLTLAGGAVIPVFDHFVVHGSPDENKEQVVERNSSLVGGMDIVHTCADLYGRPWVLRIGELDEDERFDTSQGFVYSRDTSQGPQTRFKGIDTMDNPLAKFITGYKGPEDFSLTDIAAEMQGRCPKEEIRHVLLYGDLGDYLRK